jgi:hypothetical protein
VVCQRDSEKRRSLAPAPIGAPEPTGTPGAIQGRSKRDSRGCYLTHPAASIPPHVSSGEETTVEATSFSLGCGNAPSVELTPVWQRDARSYGEQSGCSFEAFGSDSREDDGERERLCRMASEEEKACYE